MRATLATCAVLAFCGVALADQKLDARGTDVPHLREIVLDETKAEPTTDGAGLSERIDREPVCATSILRREDGAVIKKRRCSAW